MSDNTRPEPVTPPSAIPQWTRDDLRQASEAGDHTRITQAQDAGQLRDLLENGTGA